MKANPTLRALSSATVVTLALAGPASFSERALYIDGKLRTDGLATEGLRVTVARDGNVVETLAGNMSRMQLRLDLQWTYVLTFEREGYMTKELLFDTHVPFDGLGHSPFNFPFKVTLEKNPDDATLRYAQPVGYIRYFRDKMDFDYDTDYTMRRDRIVPEEYFTQRALRREVVPDALVVRPPMIRREMPSISTVLEHASMDADVATLRNYFEEVELDAPAPDRAPLPEAKPVVIVASAPVVEASETPVVIAAPRPKPVVASIIRIPAPEPVVLPDGRAEELQVERNNVTKIIRITVDGRTKEYRRIAKRYGGVDFFCDGSACSETIFASSVNTK